ncbi:MAG TPA: hypothetical protein VF053_20925 [Streptosporangiales bacterium]
MARKRGYADAAEKRLVALRRTGAAASVAANGAVLYAAGPVAAATVLGVTAATVGTAYAGRRSNYVARAVTAMRENSVRVGAATAVLDAVSATGQWTLGSHSLGAAFTAAAVAVAFRTWTYTKSAVRAVGGSLAHRTKLADTPRQVREGRRDERSAAGRTPPAGRSR